MEILRAAARVFSRLGYHRASITDVADELGITAAALYYYVDSKDQLLFEASQIAIAMMDTELAIIQADKKLSGLEKLRRYFHIYARNGVEDFGRCLALTNFDDAPPYAVAMKEGRRMMTDAVRGMIRLGIKDGSIKPCNDMLIAFALFGAANTLAKWWSPDGKLSPSAAIDGMFDPFIEGLAGAVSKPVNERHFS